MFLMEGEHTSLIIIWSDRLMPRLAVWTRFNPTMLAVQKEVFSGTIGDIRAVYSDLSMDVLDSVADSHRLFAAELAGGPLLDLGPYPLVWVSAIFQLKQVTGDKA